MGQTLLWHFPQMRMATLKKQKAISCWEMAIFQHVSLACSVFWQKGQILVKDRLHVACELGAKGTGPDIIEHNGVGLTAVD